MLLAISGCSYESDDLVNSPVEKIIETQTIEHELSHESNDSDHFHVEKNTEDQATEHELSYQSGYRFGIANPKDNADIKSELIDYITEFNTLTPSSIEATAANIQDYNFEEFYEQAYIDNNISEIESENLFDECRYALMLEGIRLFLNNQNKAKDCLYKFIIRK